MRTSQGFGVQVPTTYRRSENLNVSSLPTTELLSARKVYHWHVKKGKFNELLGM